MYKQVGALLAILAAGALVVGCSDTSSTRIVRLDGESNGRTIIVSQGSLIAISLQTIPGYPVRIREPVATGLKEERTGTVSWDDPSHFIGVTYSHFVLRAVARGSVTLEIDTFRPSGTPEVPISTWSVTIDVG